MNQSPDLAKELEALTLQQLEELYASLSDFDEHPVTIDEFIDSDRYLGSYYQGGMYPHWRQVLREVYPSPYVSPHWLVGLRGAIGIGKTQIATTGVAYDLHKLLCLSNPQQEFSLLPTTRILFAIFNVTLSLSQDVVWDNLTKMFAASPWFSKLMGPLLSRKRKGESLFPKNIDFFMGSRMGHALGKAVFSGILDEANFEVVDGQVYDTFNGLLRRMESRFMSPGGGIPGKLWVVSSETDKFSTVNKIVDSYRNKPGVFISQSPIWKVKPNKYSGNHFWVFKGSEVRQPEVLKQNDSLLTQDPSNCIEVPVEHRDAFEADVNAALRDLAGVATVSNYKLFRLRDRLTKALTISPLFPDSMTLDFDDDTDVIHSRILLEGYFSKAVQPHSPRCIHIDTGLTGDRLGIAASYIQGWRERKTRNMYTMEEITERVPEVVTEWSFGIEPTPGKQIPLFKVRMFIMWLAECGYPIHQVSCDGFQSADNLQLLKRAGFKTELISLDKTPAPYFNFRSAIYEGRAFIPQNTILRRELENLEVSPDGSEVDHPKKNDDGTAGSKDLADATAGSVFAAMSMSSSMLTLHMVDRHANQPHHDMRQFAEQFWGQRS